MDDRKMKIKIVVRPEDEQRAAADAERARQARLRRSRWGLVALFALLVAGGALALFAIGDGLEPGDPVARTDGAASPAAVAVPEPVGQRGEAPSPSSPDGAAPGEDADPAAISEAQAPATDAPPASVDAGEDDVAGEPDRAVSGSPAPRRAAAPPGAPVVDDVPAKPAAGVARTQLTSRVVGREPVDVLPATIAGGQDVYYFTEFRSLTGQTLTHRWEHDGKVMAAIPFRIGGDRWRVYSSKRVGAGQRGLWRVSVVDRDGTVLAAADFRVR